MWVSDITYIPTWMGFLYLAIVLDAFSRRVVGWAMEAHLRTELVLMALDMAFAQRCPKEVIHHSDQGTQYLGVSRLTVSEVLLETRGLSPEIAVRIGRLLNTSPESWLRMQEALDLWKVDQHPDRLAAIQPIKVAA